MKRIVVTALISSVLTLLAIQLVGYADLPKKVKLENPRVRVTEVLYQPGVPRERYIRPTDQVIVFLDDSKYERRGIVVVRVAF